MNRKFCRIWFIIGCLISTGGVSLLFAIYTYDRSGSRTGVVFPDEAITAAGKPSVRYRYDDAGRLAEVWRSDPVGGADIKSAAYEYLSDGLLAKITFSNGLITTFTYQDNGWVQAIETLNQDGALVSKYVYQYDNDGNRTVMQEYNATPAYRSDPAHADWFLHPQTTNYTYDNLGRLVQVVYRANTPDALTASYTYDAVGNRQRETETKADGITKVKDRLFAINALNQVVAITDQLAPARSVRYEYNASGDTTAKIVGELNGAQIVNEAWRLEFTWDSARRLRRVVKKTPAAGGNSSIEQLMAEFTYDYSGRRVRKDGQFVALPGGPLPAETRLYTYDQQSVLAEFGLAGNNQTPKQRQYIYGAEMLSCEHSTNNQWASSFYHQDVLGSTVNLTKLNGDLEESYVYDAWGNLRELDVNGQFNPAPNSGSNGFFDWSTYLANSQSAFQDDFNRFTYIGREYDAETSLYFLRARLYDPDTGRFVSEDPYLGDNSTPPSLHRYLYAYNNPLQYTDLTGYGVTKVLRWLEKVSPVLKPLAEKMLTKAERHPNPEYAKEIIARFFKNAEEIEVKFEGKMTKAIKPEGKKFALLGEPSLEKIEIGGRKRIHCEFGDTTLVFPEDSSLAKYNKLGGVPVKANGEFDFTNFIYKNPKTHVKFEFKWEGEFINSRREIDQAWAHFEEHIPEEFDLKEFKDNYRWHHTDDGRLVLVPRDLHEAVAHTGGTAVSKAARGAVTRLGAAAVGHGIFEGKDQPDWPDLETPEGNAPQVVGSRGAGEAVTGDKGWVAAAIDFIVENINPLSWFQDATDVSADKAKEFKKGVEQGDIGSWAKRNRQAIKQIKDQQTGKK